MFADEIHRAVGRLIVTLDLDDVGMIERAQDFVLLPNPSAEFLADQEARPQYFDHHLFLHGEVEGAVDFRAVASADVAVDAETLVENGVEYVGVDAERFEGARVGAAGGHRW